MRAFPMVIVLAAGAAASAQVVPFTESEPNNSLATADFISQALYPTGAVAIDGAVSAGDVDFFSFNLSAGDFVAFSVFELTPGGSDGYLGIFGPGGVLFAADDDNGPGLMPSYAFFVTQSGTWTFGVTGYGDGGFVGDHDESFQYKAVFAINPVVPTPGALGLLGASGLIAARRRR